MLVSAQSDLPATPEPQPVSPDKYHEAIIAGAEYCNALQNLCISIAARQTEEARQEFEAVKPIIQPVWQTVQHLEKLRKLAR
jgi:hypothetical protein